MIEQMLKDGWVFDQTWTNAVGLESFRKSFHDEDELIHVTISNGLSDNSILYLSGGETFGIYFPNLEQALTAANAIIAGRGVK